jgi:hypothetical protein
MFEKDQSENFIFLDCIHPSIIDSFIHSLTALAPKAHQIDAKAPSDWSQPSPSLLCTPRARWTISMADPTYKGYQTAEKQMEHERNGFSGKEV